MTDTTTTSGALDRVRAWTAAVLATALVALTGALATPAAEAEPHPDHRPTYTVTADLDGRATPARGEEAIVEEDFLRKGQAVPVICQASGDRAYGSRIWDLVSNDGDTYFVPDRFIKTGTDGRAPEIRRCTKKDLKRVTRPPTPYPPTHP
jgi:LmbE family N-acetylglucosaminyl deacetylase